MPKRTKAVKESDKKPGKAWDRRKNPTRDRIETRELNKTILIVCEGQTEKVYFESFPVITLTVKIEDRHGESKSKLVESAKRINSEEPYDEVWCVFDMDVKDGKAEFADFDNAIDLAKKLNFKVAYSNDSFELWFYLHFQYTDQQNHRDYYYIELSDRWGINYEKEGKRLNFCRGIYNALKSSTSASQTEAIRRAAKIHEDRKHLPYHQQNPVTLVYKLVQLLNENLRK